MPTNVFLFPAIRSFAMMSQQIITAVNEFE